MFHAFDVVCRLFSKLTFSKNSFRNTIRVSNCLDPDQDRPFVGPNLGPNCLQRLYEDNLSGKAMNIYKQLSRRMKLFSSVVIGSASATEQLHLY